MDPMGLLLTNNDPSYDSAERGTREVSLHEAHAADQSLHWDPQRQKIQTGKVGFKNMEGRKTCHIVVFVVISLFLRLFRSHHLVSCKWREKLLSFPLCYLCMFFFGGGKDIYIYLQYIQKPAWKRGNIWSSVRSNRIAKTFWTWLSKRKHDIDEI